MSEIPNILWLLHGLDFILDTEKFMQILLLVCLDYNVSNWAHLVNISKNMKNICNKSWTFLQVSNEVGIDEWKYLLVWVYGPKTTYVVPLHFSFWHIYRVDQLLVNLYSYLCCMWVGVGLGEKKNFAYMLICMFWFFCAIIES